MRYFITGATGFIGSHLCQRLLDDGHEIIALIRSPHKLSAELKAKMQIIPGDLTYFEQDNLKIPPVDIVIHLAAVIAGKNQQEYHDINCQAVDHLLKALNTQDWRPKRLLFASSLAAAGPSEGKILTESHAPAPIDAYGEAKLAAERLMAKQDFPITIFRPSLVLGPGDPATLTLYKMAASGFAVLPAGPPQNLSLIDVGELVDAILRMSQSDDEADQLYFATSDVIRTNAQLLEAMATALGNPLRILRLPKFLLFIAMIFTTLASKIIPFKNQLDLKQYKQMTAKAFLCSSQKLQDELDWKPLKTLPEILEGAIEGYRERGQLPPLS